jgi:CRISPR-associated protein Csm3
MTQKSINELADKLEPGMIFAEVKHEVSIDRKKGTASFAGPRPVERVPAGAEFRLNMAIRIFEGDDEAKMVAFIDEGFAMLKDDYLGGSGTRGYGKVDITEINADDL